MLGDCRGAISANAVSGNLEGMVRFRLADYTGVDPRLRMRTSQGYETRHTMRRFENLDQRQSAALFFRIGESPSNVPIGATAFCQ